MDCCVLDTLDCQIKKKNHTNQFDPARVVSCKFLSDSSHHYYLCFISHFCVQDILIILILM